MKLVIEEAWCQYQNKITGVAKFFYSMCNISKNLDIETIVFDKGFIKNIKNSTLLTIVYIIWLNTVFLYKLLKLNDDVVVLGVRYFIPFIKLPRVEYYPVVHDLIAVKYPDKVSKSSATLLKLLTKNAIINGDRIITVSETAKKEISQYYNYAMEKIDVIYNTFSIDTNITLDENTVLNKYGIQRSNYILSVSSLSGHKNINSLIEAHNILVNKNSQTQLVIVGNGANLKIYKEMANEKVIFTGSISDEELKVLYKNAKIYAFPSILEGFGLPIIDAQQFGIPILCTDMQVFREVAGNKGAVFVEPKVENLANELSKLLCNENLQNKLKQNGYVNIKRFSNEVLTQQLHDIINLGVQKKK